MTQMLTCGTRVQRHVNSLDRTRRPGNSGTRATRGEAAAVRREGGAEDETPSGAIRLSSPRSLAPHRPAAPRPVSLGFISAEKST